VGFRLDAPPRTASSFLQVFWFQSGPLGNSREHARTDFVAIVKREDIVWPIWAGEDTVGSFDLALDIPSTPQKGGKHLPGFCRLLKNSLSPRLLKKVQMLGGARRAE
jgi:hypothetical protein